MNIYLGGFGGGLSTKTTIYGNIPELKPAQFFLKLTSISRPTQFFVFLDMRQDSVDVGNFATATSGYPDQPQLHKLLDLPGFYHGRAGGFSFADGHSEIKKWRDARTMKPLNPSGTVRDDYPSPRNQDIAWLQENALRLK